MPKLCPLKTDPEKVGSDCDELDCAWWDEQKTHCIIVTIAENLFAISENIDAASDIPTHKIWGTDH